MRLTLGDIAQGFDLVNPSFYYPLHEELDEWSRTDSSSKVQFALCRNCDVSVFEALVTDSACSSFICIYGSSSSLVLSMERPSFQRIEHPTMFAATVEPAAESSPYPTCFAIPFKQSINGLVPITYIAIARGSPCVFFLPLIVDSDHQQTALRDFCMCQSKLELERGILL